MKKSENKTASEKSPERQDLETVLKSVGVNETKIKTRRGTYIIPVNELDEPTLYDLFFNVFSGKYCNPPNTWIETYPDAYAEETGIRGTNRRVRACDKTHQYKEPKRIGRGYKR